ncbi:NAD(P)-binding domain-containing protein [Pseudokineococcus sp. 5B2Z-1]|uniref:NADPH-dependent F420 reductase n=1 Tax=Pseudokineococcus sp. 5B2Z-1 TaxID=3132744 RepID=UPI0030A368C1
MTTIGLIGAGNIGSTVARLAVDAGYDVVLSNSRGPETLADLVGELGPRARAATATEAAEAGDLVVVTVPLHAYQAIPAAPLAAKTVIDTNNYYPDRDGHVDALDHAEATTSGLLQEHLQASHVVKAFNNIFFVALGQLGRPQGEERSALPVFGDHAGAKGEVTAFLDAIGYDVVDGGGLDDSWRSENGRPVYVMPYATDGDVTKPSRGSAEDVREALARADRVSEPQPAQAAPPS